MTEVAAFMLTMNFLACADTSAAASAFGVRSKPAMMSTLVAHDHLLRQALGDVRRDAAGVLADEFDLLAGDGVAVLLHVELDAVVDLGAGIGELSRIGHDHADLDGALGAAAVRRPRAAWRRSRQARSLRVAWVPPEGDAIGSFCWRHLSRARAADRNGRGAQRRAATVAPPGLAGYRCSAIRRAFTGSLTFSTLSNATFCGSPFTFSTLRM